MAPGPYDKGGPIGEGSAKPPLLGTRTVGVASDLTISNSVVPGAPKARVRGELRSPNGDMMPPCLGEPDARMAPYPPGLCASTMGPAGCDELGARTSCVLTNCSGGIAMPWASCATICCAAAGDSYGTVLDCAAPDES